MKIYNKILMILVAGAMLFTAACTDLEIEVQSQYTSDNFPTTAEDYEALTGPIYTTFNPAMGRYYWQTQTLSSDEMIMPAKNGGWYDGGRYQQFHNHTWNGDNAMIVDIWDYGFQSVSATNRVLSILESAPEGEQKDRGIAEVRTMRAFYMYLMTDNFGAIPIVDKWGGDKVYDRSPRSEVVEFIEQELIESIPYLNKNIGSNTYSRPTYYMANALLAKLYINWEVYTGETKWDEAVSACDAVIKDGVFELDDDYMSMFSYDNGPQIKDFIYAMPFDGERIQGMYHARFWLHKKQRNRFELPFNPSGPLRCVPEFYNKFNLAGDERNNMWLTGPQYELDGSPLIIPTTNKGLNSDYDGPEPDAEVLYHLTFTQDWEFKDYEIFDIGDDELKRAYGYRCIKFYPDKTSSSRNQSNDVPVFRYADVLLMKAEAILRGAKATLGDSPVSLMNQIRNRVEAPEVASVTLEELLDERAREFYSENWRRNDLIRFGKFGDAWGWKSAYNDVNKIIFPVPNVELDINPHWSQNPGY
ncbi:RagB/SusD family nutrient uptake outer membrane protein [Maribellus luteus]|uniref:RagB/SusD family nutrient uptake outer membrane protein n=1 Tax=Maribellus luteus TaxID=2305463 RepID=A0A399SWF1_9BACT|nr:RagB/SusD family nutrient uptake outer membrane protein [Maribellus luteus]RIJ46465.1 RagB/SusD family nutrient uptake outer membrane protein [Maribellus luteus]